RPEPRRQERPRLRRRLLRRRRSRPRRRRPRRPTERAGGASARRGARRRDRVAMTAEPPASTVKSGDIARLMTLLPHRYPFLMVDRMVEMVLGERAVGLKNVSVNEPHFQGHFPGEPIMPGVLLIEAMAQTAGALVVETLGDAMHGKLVYFMSV